MNWSRGYVSDVGYTAGFYRETAPAHMAFAALAVGQSPGRSIRPSRFLELGFGQGFGLALLAAANPDVVFEGYDFNPEHVAHARRLVDEARLQNVSVTETSFEDAAARGGQSNVDVITLHGIFSWVARPVQDAIVAILRDRLQPDGLAYVSYNCMPGWAPLAPIRQLMLEIKRRNPGRSERQLNIGLNTLNELRNGGAAFFGANPIAAQHLDAMARMDRVYLAHEYLDEHWDLFQFSEMNSRMGEARLSYLMSATIPENIDQYAAPPAIQQLASETGDPVLKQTLFDYAANRRFRRDVYARGMLALTPAEHRRSLAGLSFALVVPASSVIFKFAGPLTELSGREVLYRPIIDCLAAREAGFNELLALPAFGERNIGTLVDCLALLVHSGQVQPIVQSPPEASAAHRFNRMIVAHAQAGRIYSHLASPLLRTGIAVNDFGLLALAAIYEGTAEQSAAVAQHVMSILKLMGRRPMKEGKSLTDDYEATTFLEAQMTPILSESVPLWRRLGIL